MTGRTRFRKKVLAFTNRIKVKTQLSSFLKMSIIFKTACAGTLVQQSTTALWSIYAGHVVILQFLFRNFLIVMDMSRWYFFKPKQDELE